ncbi:hypothetical protein [Endozoicomonas euniceicola]|uniref:Anti-sigma-28 factor FlgM C-terminal domain-containing protein n=1 Tax=Endozoicomonas euniceicola TaxID=1234143 RepID=A0ABY6GPR7_9GAMM|nr:hypothetical protein [Endozoicomonas euniceicola]UYM14751.1 hypothetical protein NX720_17910 [Endozoicomonas euniceicola]
MINNTDAEPLRPDSSRNPVDPVQPKSPVDAIEADRFSDMMKKNKDMEAAASDNQAAEGEITPEELQRQIREGMFKTGFQKAIERAKEMTKEMKQ